MATLVIIRIYHTSDLRSMNTKLGAVNAPTRNLRLSESPFCDIQHLWPATLAWLHGCNSSGSTGTSTDKPGWLSGARSGTG
jgi:hypothetical protein